LIATIKLFVEVIVDLDICRSKMSLTKVREE
jgi:hypothetical protein